MTEQYVEADHWTQVAAAQWRWPHFSPQEMACRGTGRIRVAVRLMDKLEELRRYRGGRPMIVTSGYRSPEHNARVGGAPASQHMVGLAADIAVGNHDPAELVSAARVVGFRGIGTYPRQGFVHIDLGPARTWGEPFPTAPAHRRAAYTDHPPEPVAPPAGARRETGADAAAVAVAGGGGATLALSIADRATSPGTLGLLDRLGEWAPVAILVVVLGAAVWWWLRRRSRRRTTYEADEGHADAGG